MNDASLRERVIFNYDRLLVDPGEVVEIGLTKEQAIDLASQLEGEAGRLMEGELVAIHFYSKSWESTRGVLNWIVSTEPHLAAGQKPQ